ncbi:hypothetical protein [Actinomyces sp. HMT897]|uniref:hypothetical protein n=1 Tax=Actinomyces sp. HMT897 TaxID=2789424 RepID=UPI00190C99A9|nr:hypothetical protein [Actinomyces sp. HMT897]QQO78166.1 hypothetical protein JJJ15_02020 [Actinomyces sp. HMT897]
MTEWALASLTGSRTGESVRVTARVGSVVVDVTEVGGVSTWWLEADASRAVQTQGGMTVADPDGVLTPYLPGDPLAPGGRIQIAVVMGDGSQVPRATMVITESIPMDSWRQRQGVWQRTGSTVSLSLSDLAVLLQRDRFQTPWSRAGASALTEVQRMCAGIVNTITDTTSSAGVPADFVAERERLDAIDDLLHHAGLDRRLDGAGVLHILDPTRSRIPVWEVSGGDGQALVEVSRSMSLVDVVNAVVATSSATGGANHTELVGRAYLEDGVERWDGPLGNCTEFYASPLITTQEQAQKAARTRLDNLTTNATTSVNLTTLPHPGIELHDTVRVQFPSASRPLTLTGTVTRWRLEADEKGMKPMTMTLTLPRREMLRMKWRW